MRNLIFLILIVAVFLAAVDCAAKKHEPRTHGFEHVKDKGYGEHWKKHRMGKGHLYTQSEVESHERHFFNRKRQIDEHNAKAGVSYQQGLNEHSDKNQTEYDKMLGGKPNPEARSLPSPVKPYVVTSTPPAKVDWRPYSPTPLNQGSCGSCWAFASCSAIDTFHRITTGKVLGCSPQYYVDCSAAPNNGCLGGAAYYFFKTLEHEGFKTATLPGYPMTSQSTGTNGTCNANAPKTSTPFLQTNFVTPGGNITLAKQLVNSFGPIVISMQVYTLPACRNFYNYRSGLYVDTCGCSMNCSVGINHALVLEGYGVTTAGEEFWYLKNSWGTTWGEAGYVRWKIDPTNKCDILCELAYVEKA